MHLDLAAALRPAPGLRLVVPPEAPWPGEVVQSGDGLVQRVDLAELEEWPGWDAGSAHVLGVRAITRRPDGHDALLPLCTEPIEALCLRRGEHAPMQAGEAVTAIVSMLRGFHEDPHLPRGSTCRGAWWVTDEGRPVFVHAALEANDAPLLERATLSALDAVGEATNAVGLPGLLADVRAHVRDEIGAEDVTTLESRLFAFARATAIATRVPVLSAPRHTIEVAERVEGAGVAGQWVRLMRSADGGLGDLAAEALASVRSGWYRLTGDLRAPRGVHRKRESEHAPSSPRRSRRMAVVVGLAVGAATAAAGLLWVPGEAFDDEPRTLEPSGAAVHEGAAAPATKDGTGAVAETADGAGNDTGTTDGGERVATVPQGAAVSTDALSGFSLATAHAVLDALSACAEDACRARFQDGSGPGAVRGAALTVGRELRLVDDLGGYASVVARTAEPSAEQLVVFVARDDGWVVRQITDLPHHP